MGRRASALPPFTPLLPGLFRVGPAIRMRSWRKRMPAASSAHASHEPPGRRPEPQRRVSDARMVPWASAQSFSCPEDSM